MLPRQHSASIWLITLLMASFFTVSCSKDVKTVKQAKTEEVASDLINPFGNYWTQLINTPVIPGPYSNDQNLSFSVNNKVYAVPLGPNQLWEYDPATSQWTQLQSTFFPFSFSNYVDVFCNGNSVYVLNAATKDFREYNVQSNQWTDRPDFPGAAKANVASTYTFTNGYIIAGSGDPIVNDNNPNVTTYVTLKENWEYNFATNTWTQKANFPGTGRYVGAAHAAGDNVYFGTGISNRILLNPITLEISYSPQINSDWWEFNTLTNTWTQKAAFGGGARMDTRGFVLGGKVYMGLGAATYYSDLRSDLWSYNASANSWTQRADYPPGNGYPPFNTMLAAGSRGYSVTGKIAEFWRYTPPTIILPPGGLQ